MRKSRFSKDQMVRILREADKETVPKVAKRHGVSEQIIYAWRKRYGELEVADVRRLGELEAENARLNKMFAERDARDARSGNPFWARADAVVEIVSPASPQRDLVHKRDNYTEAAIPEYWIVDPQTETIAILVLGNAEYVTHGVHPRNARTSPPALPGFTVNTGDVFNAAGGE